MRDSPSEVQQSRGGEYPLKFRSNRTNKTRMSSDGRLLRMSPSKKKSKSKPPKSKKKKNSTPPKKKGLKKVKGPRPKTSAKKKLTKKKASKKRASIARTASKRRKPQPKRVQRLQSSWEDEVPVSGRESGDLQGLSSSAEADSESVDELMEEGNAFEASAIAGVEEAGDEGTREVHTHEVPEDDVPEEYLDKE